MHIFIYIASIHNLYTLVYAYTYIHIHTHIHAHKHTGIHIVTIHRPITGHCCMTYASQPSPTL